MPPVPASTQSRPLPASSGNYRKSLPGPVVKKPKGSKQNKLVIGLGMTIVVIILLGVISSILRSNINRFQTNNNSRLQPTMTPIPTFPPASPVYGQPSQYANDPQILQLEGAIRNFQNEMTADSLNEPEIQPPILEKKINFTGK